jgi:hypothetical protein
MLADVSEPAQDFREREGGWIDKVFGAAIDPFVSEAGAGSDEVNYGDRTPCFRPACEGRLKPSMEHPRRAKAGDRPWTFPTPAAT